MVLYCVWAEDRYRRYAAHRKPLWKEAFNMQDNFSAGSVFYGRTLALVAAVMAIAIILRLI